MPRRKSISISEVRVAGGRGFLQRMRRVAKRLGIFESLEVLAITSLAVFMVVASVFISLVVVIA
jgi:hypothetical protein